AGESIMAAASTHGVPGVEAICGGFCNCATCHVYVAEAWINLLPPPEDAENEMLDGTAAERLPGSRLSCQVKVTEALNGITVRMPEIQA
ncbi:MAG TPA: 2Fe-2S iron-sulfur cluster-binding protein, partial [Acetobacteraceae bacterium]|nr:2Fe-2S iron-sulfur cluster-binding protein [Acetobacteraceae bacterium]